MTALSQNVFAADDAPGYTDTPLLPNSTWRVHDQARPQPPKVTPGTGDLGATPPSDAVVLFDGKNLEHWKGQTPERMQSGIADEKFDIAKTGQIYTAQEFGSCQLHVEWMTPTTPQDRMNWGNSGVILMGCVEIQVIESHDSFIYADGNAGSIYGQYPPLVNPARKPGEWQSFDITFTAPKIEDGKQVTPGYVTVFYNGVLVQNHREVLGKMAHRELPAPIEVEKGPLLLQEHGSAVQYRNIWIRNID
ncbi:MAG: 3-keto-disaccharide hydrolase [Thermoguttaceae bacterium]